MQWCQRQAHGACGNNRLLGPIGKLWGWIFNKCGAKTHRRQLVRIKNVGEGGQLGSSQGQGETWACWSWAEIICKNPFLQTTSSLSDMSEILVQEQLSCLPQIMKSSNGLSEYKRFKQLSGWSQTAEECARSRGGQPPLRHIRWPYQGTISQQRMGSDGPEHTEVAPPLLTEHNHQAFPSAPFPINFRTPWFG